MDFTSLNHAAICLAEAAARMSTAAQAMNVAVEAFSAANIDVQAMLTDSLAASRVVESSESTSGDDYESVLEDIGASDFETIRSEDSVDEVDAELEVEYVGEGNNLYIPEAVEGHTSVHMRRENEEDNCSFTSSSLLSAGPDTPLIVSPPASPPKDSSSAPPMSSLRSFESLGESSLKSKRNAFQRHILVKSEVEILPIVCALSAKYLKVLCYLSCPVSSIAIYQQLIEKGSETPVYAAVQNTTDGLDLTYKAFEMDERAILLVPENKCPRLIFHPRSRSCVFHVGWPHNAERYKAQIDLHKAPHSILVALDKDKDIYPSGSKLLFLTSPWPEESPVLWNESITSRLQAAASEFPLILKHSFFEDWILLHGPYGRRNISSWTPLKLLHRGNVHVLDTLQYDALATGTEVSGRSSPVNYPCFLDDFIESVEMELSVVDDPPQVDPLAPGLDEPLSATIDTTLDIKPEDNPHIREPPFSAEEMPEISAVPATSEISNRTLDSSSSQTQAIIMHPAEPDSAGPQHAQVYSPCAGFTVEHEFDILPAFCGLIKKYDKVICYAAYPQSVLDMLGGLIREVTGRQVFLCPSGLRIGLMEVASEFNDMDQAVFLVQGNLPARVVLGSAGISCLIHLDWPIDYASYMTQIMTHQAPISILVAHGADIYTYPYATDILSQLFPFDEKQRFESEVMMAMSVKATNFLVQLTPHHKAQLYADWIHYYGPDGPGHVRCWSRSY